MITKVKILTGADSKEQIEGAINSFLSVNQDISVDSIIYSGAFVTATIIYKEEYK